MNLFVKREALKAAAKVALSLSAVATAAACSSTNESTEPQADEGALHGGSSTSSARACEAKLDALPQGTDDAPRALPSTADVKSCCNTLLTDYERAQSEGDGSFDAQLTDLPADLAAKLKKGAEETGGQVDSSPGEGGKVTLYVHGDRGVELEMPGLTQEEATAQKQAFKDGGAASASAKKQSDGTYTLTVKAKAESANAPIRTKYKMGCCRVTAENPQQWWQNNAHPGACTPWGPPMPPSMQAETDKNPISVREVA